MLKDSKKFSRLKDEWKKAWKKELVDIILFGSITRGKKKPGDIDLCLIFRDKINLELTKQIQVILGEEYHLSTLTIDNFFTDTHSLTKTILLEGKSLITGKKFADNFGLVPQLSYTYDLSQEKPSKKVRFVYLLRGREKGQGIVERMGGRFMSGASFMIPLEKDAEMKEIFDGWRIKYQRKRVMLMN
ncbi:MAG: nucleotidyltransferase domain-containing protein [Candidatus Woesearchaeota archaeon]